MVFKKKKCGWVTLVATIGAATAADPVACQPSLNEMVEVTVDFGEEIQQEGASKVGNALAANIWNYACGNANPLLRCSADAGYYKLSVDIFYVPPNQSIFKPKEEYWCFAHLYGKGFLGKGGQNANKYVQSMFFRCHSYPDLNGLLSANAFFVDDVDDPDINAIRKE